MTQKSRTWRQLAWVFLFAAAFALVEASVVVYLRALYYPEGFRLPLKLLPAQHYGVELAREAATMVMLLTVAALSGRGRWRRFGFLLVAFGSWDILFYAWLRVILGWPAALTDWDVLFLLPVPWIGPVIAPVLISVLMIGGGMYIVLCTDSGAAFHAGLLSWFSALAGSALLLFTFMSDTAATLHGAVPSGYRYDLFAAGMALCLVSWGIVIRRTRAR